MGKDAFRVEDGVAIYSSSRGEKFIPLGLYADLVEPYDSVDSYWQYDEELDGVKYVFHEFYGDGDTYAMMCLSETPAVPIAYYYITSPVYRGGSAGYGDDEVETTIYMNAMFKKELIKINLQLTEQKYKAQNENGELTRRHIHDVLKAMGRL